MQHVSKRKIRTQQVPLILISPLQARLRKKVLRGKNQHATGFVKKISTQQVPGIKISTQKFHEQNQFYEEKNKCTSFAKKKKSKCNKFQQQKSGHMKFYKEISIRYKFHEQNMFHEEKNQLVTSFTNKNQRTVSSMNKTKFSTKRVS